MSLRFGQSCPTCGRRIKIRMELLGRSVACPHCRAEFNAADKQPRQQDSDHMLMARVERALRQAEDPAFIE